MLLTPEIQRGISTWLSANHATYNDLCAKIADDPHDRPSPSTISRWISGKVRFIHDPLAQRLVTIIGIDPPEQDTAPSRLGLSKFSLELAQKVEFLPPKYRTRIRNFVSDEMNRYVVEANAGRISA